jgi:hypothetical protein
LINASPETGRADYHRLSAFTHSTLWAVIAGRIEVEQHREGNPDSLQVHSLLIAIAGARYVLTGVQSLIRTKALSIDDLDRTSRRFNELEAQTMQAAEHID